MREVTEYLSLVNTLKCRGRINGLNTRKSSIHRILKLFAHTLQLLRNIIYVVEMVRQACHKVLEFCLYVNTHDDSHITVVEHELRKRSEIILIGIFVTVMETSDRHVGELQSLVRIPGCEAVSNLRQEDKGYKEIADLVMYTTTSDWLDSFVYIGTPIE